MRLWRAVALLFLLSACAAPLPVPPGPELIAQSRIYLPFHAFSLNKLGFGSVHGWPPEKHEPGGDPNWPDTRPGANPSLLSDELSLTDMGMWYAHPH